MLTVFKMGVIVLSSPIQSEPLLLFPVFLYNWLCVTMAAFQSRGPHLACHDLFVCLMDELISAASMCSRSLQKSRPRLGLHIREKVVSISGLSACGGSETKPP